ncbi:flavodoxin family protein [Rickettsiales bacterium]|nr:flavodoxin family protein [Rickettsiales bacterium]MDB2550697.1 flavodoxin family protein [Rickettsiales bacterium]
MVKISIIYHSGFGHTKVQAQAVYDGASSSGEVEVKLVTADEAIANIHQFDDSDAIIFGSPTYMGSVSAKFKEFMDASSPIWLKQGWKDKIAAGFTNSYSLSGDKLNTLMQIGIYAMQHSMIWVGLGHDNTCKDGEQGDINAINRMGSYFGAMAQSDNKPSDVTPPSGDIKTAQILGQRVANLTKKFKNND